MTPERYQQVAQLYVAALELAPEQRAGFLTEACCGDSALQEDVESLLRFEAYGERFLDGAALDVTAQAVAAEQLASSSHRRVGHYHIQSLLGRGGMGEVYRAHDPRLGRDVALKVIHVAFATDVDRLRRFEQEARAAGRLNHPNVLTVYDIGIDQDAPYIVTELLEGEELREQLNRGVVPFRRAVDYARQNANGLTAAHAKGIVRRCCFRSIASLLPYRLCAIYRGKRPALRRLDPFIYELFPSSPRERRIAYLRWNSLSFRS
jgi:hypothetical protein